MKIASAILAYLVAVAIAIHSVSPAGVLSFASYWASWPANAASRLGLPQGWIAVVLLTFAAIASTLRLPPSHRSGRASALVAAYLASALVFFVLVPVPTPLTSRFDTCSPQLGHAYRAAFADAYRWALTDNFVRFEGNFPPATTVGWFDGYAAGSAERMRAFPFAESKLTVALQSARKTNRPWLYPSQLCKDTPLKIYSYGS
jgi:hypothetical protein